MTARMKRNTSLNMMAGVVGWTGCQWVERQQTTTYCCCLLLLAVAVAFSCLVSVVAVQQLQISKGKWQIINNWLIDWIINQINEKIARVDRRLRNARNYICKSECFSDFISTSIVKQDANSTNITNTQHC